MEQYSILMSVYHKANPQFFVEAIQSMVDQIYPSNDFVIVCDGPLTAELDAVLENFDAKYPGLFQILRLPENMGIGAAAAAGLQVCKNDLVAKMDADDIALPFRCSMQVERFERNPRLTMVGGFVEEFEENPEKPFSVRTVPLTNEQIRKYARRRQPFNNPSIMYRRSAVLAVGGYGNLRRSEDYDLYVRLLHKGYEAENIETVLVKFRVDAAARLRRTSIVTAKGFFQGRWNALRLGYSSLWDFVVCCGAELFVLLCPKKLQDMIYVKFLRKRL